jgi:hypothetical protein
LRRASRGTARAHRVGQTGERDIDDGLAPAGSAGMFPLSEKADSKAPLAWEAPTTPLDVQAVKRIVAIIEEVGQSPSGLTMSEIALATGL